MNPEHEHAGDFNMRWMADRLDRIEQTMDDRFERLSDDIVKSRHGLKDVVGTMAEQMANLVTLTAEHQRRHEAADASLRRKGERISALERWRSYLAGALAVVMFLFPTTVGVVLAVMKD